VVPYPFPRDLRRIAQYALNLRPEAHLHWRALPAIAPFLLRYWAASAPARLAQAARAMRPLIERCVLEHQLLMRDAGIEDRMRRTGYLRFFRSAAALAAEVAQNEASRDLYGVKFRVLDCEGMRALEPCLAGGAAGAVLMPDPVSVADPAAVAKAYARRLVERGGRFLKGDARSLKPVPSGWQGGTAEGGVVAPGGVGAR